MTRPDLVFNVPVTHHMLRANTVYWKGHVDFSLFVLQSAATTFFVDFFVDATLSYWRCEQISETSGEGWITKGGSTRAMLIKYNGSGRGGPTCRPQGVRRVCQGPRRTENSLAVFGWRCRVHSKSASTR